MPNSENDIQYSLGKICGSIEAIQVDISEIKDTMIPDGTSRIGAVEKKVQTLTVWKKTTTALGIFLVGMAGWIEAKANIIGGLFDG